MCSCIKALVFLVIYLLTSLQPDKRVITMPTLLIVLKSCINGTMNQWCCSLSQRWWYSGEHSCLPSSWPGFDSRPSQLPLAVPFNHVGCVLFYTKNLLRSFCKCLQCQARCILHRPRCYRLLWKTTLHTGFHFSSLHTFLHETGIGHATSS